MIWAIDLASLSNLPISAYCGLLKFEMKIFVNVARLEICQLFTQDARRGASVYFGHISSYLGSKAYLCLSVLGNH